jgi:hypothetical protein
VKVKDFRAGMMMAPFNVLTIFLYANKVHDLGEALETYRPFESKATSIEPEKSASAAKRTSSISVGRSAMGHERPCAFARVRSALGPRADIGSAELLGNFRLGAASRAQSSLLPVSRRSPSVR